MVLWFFEQKTLGRWWPCTAPEPPALKSADGYRKPIRGAIEVDPRHASYSLKALREIYSRDGRLVATQGPEHVAKVRGLP